MKLCGHSQGFTEDNKCSLCNQGYGNDTFSGGRVLPHQLYTEWLIRKGAGHRLAHVLPHGQPGDMRDHYSLGFVDHTEKVVVVMCRLRWANDRGIVPEGVQKDVWFTFVQCMATVEGRNKLFGPWEPCPMNYNLV